MKSIEPCRIASGDRRHFSPGPVQALAAVRGNPRLVELLVCALAAVAPACNDRQPSGAGGVTGSTGDYGSFVEAVHPSDGAAHSQVCDPLTFRSSPPSSGTHYPIWAAYKTYAQPVPWGFLVHAMEHGAMVVVYNCPAGCASEVAAAQAWIDGLPADDICGGGRPRVILAPDPMLDCRWAVAAWQWTLRGGTFDPAPFQKFFANHYENPAPGLSAPEPGVCADGVDLSADGWCP